MRRPIVKIQFLLQFKSIPPRCQSRPYIPQDQGSWYRCRCLHLASSPQKHWERVAMCRLIVIICKNISGNICGAENITTHILLRWWSTTDWKGCYRYDHDKAMYSRKYFIMEIGTDQGGCWHEGHSMWLYKYQFYFHLSLKRWIYDILLIREKLSFSLLL